MKCSFCGKEEFEVEYLVAASNACICDICAEVVQDIIAEKRGEKWHTVAVKLI